MLCSHNRRLSKVQCEPHIVQFFSKVGLFPNKRNYEAFMFYYFNATAFMFYYFNATAGGAMMILDLGPRSWNMATTFSMMGDEFLSIIQKYPFPVITKLRHLFPLRVWISLHFWGIHSQFSQRVDKSSIVGGRIISPLSKYSLARFTSKHFIPLLKLLWKLEKLFPNFEPGWLLKIKARQLTS